MTGRPRLEIGTFGEILTQKTTAGGYQALARFRDWDGQVRRITATGASKAAATSALKKKIAERDRITDTGEAVTADTPFPEVARLWLEDILIDPALSDGTKETYEKELRTLLLPTWSSFTLREMTVARVERFLKVQHAKSYARAKHSKVLLGLIFRWAMRHGAIPRNPVDATSRLRRPVCEPQALSRDDLDAIREAARIWRTVPGQSGPKPDGQVRDLIEVMLGTSARIGEALGIRKCDVDVAANPATVRICGTIVVRKGNGTFDSRSRRPTRPHALLRSRSSPPR